MNFQAGLYEVENDDFSHLNIKHISTFSEIELC